MEGRGRGRDGTVPYAGDLSGTGLEEREGRRGSVDGAGAGRNMTREGGGTHGGEEGEGQGTYHQGGRCPPL